MVLVNYVTVFEGRPNKKGGPDHKAKKEQTPGNIPHDEQISEFAKGIHNVKLVDDILIVEHSTATLTEHRPHINKQQQQGRKEGVEPI